MIVYEPICGLHLGSRSKVTIGLEGAYLVFLQIYSSLCTINHVNDIFYGIMESFYAFFSKKVKKFLFTKISY